MNPRINRIVARLVLVLSLVALVTVLIGYTRPRTGDEGALAHLFQLSVAILVPAVLLFLATADWSRRWRSMRPLALPALALALAFGALYFLEHR